MSKLWYMITPLKQSTSASKASIFFRCLSRIGFAAGRISQLELRATRPALVTARTAASSFRMATRNGPAQTSSGATPRASASPVGVSMTRTAAQGKSIA